MSVIVYRNGVIASDSYVYGDNGCLFGEVQKIGTGQHGIVGAACGDASVCSQFFTWLKNFDTPHFNPRKQVDDFGGFIVKADGSILFINSVGVLTFVNTKFIADGSGSQLAIGAMAFGASAVEAVEIACKYDPYCGGKVQSIKIDIINDSDVVPGGPRGIVKKYGQA